MPWPAMGWNGPGPCCVRPLKLMLHGWCAAASCRLWRNSPTLIWVSLGAPLLILLALLATQQRQGKDRIQALPAVLVGSGLIISSALGRQRRRARLLADLQRARTPGSNP